MYTTSITNLTLSAGYYADYYIDLNANQNVYCSTYGPNGDADIFMKIEYMALPHSHYDCASAKHESEIRNFDACSVRVYEPMRVYVAVHAFEAFSNLNLTCTVRSPEMYTSTITSMALSLRDVNQYYMDLTAGQVMYCFTFGSNPNTVLYMKIEYPYRRSYDCMSGHNRFLGKFCAVAVFEPRRVYISVFADEGFNDHIFGCDVSFLAMYTAPITNMTLNYLDIRQYYMDVGANQVVYCSINGPNGNADMYMNIGSAAVPLSPYNDCLGLGDTSNEQCTVAVLEPKRVYIAVFATKGFNGLALTCTVRSTSAPTFLPSTSKPTTRPPTS
jgi:hypothetical protein